MSCPYCEAATNDFISINQTVEHSNIEVTVNKQGMLRARVFDVNDGLATHTEINFQHKHPQSSNCPMNRF